MYIMEGMMKKQSCGVGNGNGNGSGMGMRKDSQIISKVKPKIRIIHIFAPEIIKTDVANFRELVQRLTGKPTDNNHKNGSSGGIKRRQRISGGTRKLQEPLIRPLMTKKMEIMRSGFHQYRFSSSSSSSSCSSSDDQLRERIKGEEEIWKGANSGGGFLGGFTELEGFMEQLNNEFPLLPVDAPTHVESAAYGQSLQLA